MRFLLIWCSTGLLAGFVYALKGRPGHPRLNGLMERASKERVLLWVLGEFYLFGLAALGGPYMLGLVIMKLRTAQNAKRRE